MNPDPLTVLPDEPAPRRSRTRSLNAAVGCFLAAVALVVVAAVLGKVGAS